ncbi:MAG: hemolysin family protein [bacterium]|nr:hemolysin family protein [bacterium]
MDESHLPSLVTLGWLILLHALVRLAYEALTNCRLTPLHERADEGDGSAKRTLMLLKNLSQLHMTAELLLTAIRFGIVAVAVAGVAQPLIAAADSGGLFADPAAAYLVVLIPVGAFTYILGDLIPAVLGRAWADTVTMIVTPILRVLVFFLNPVLMLLNAVQALVSRISGGENLQKHVTEEEIMSLVDVGHSGGTIEPDEKEMIYSVLQFNETAVREIMIPRPDITAVEIDAPISEAIKQAVESGHSRIPVYDDEIDDIKGLLFAKDVLALVQRGELEHASIRSIMRKAYFVPESKRADVLFRDMQAGNYHIAIVVDEYGSTAGLVTLEDLVEEIVGDIKDEYDQNEEAEFTVLGENTFLVDGAMQIDDLNERLESSIPTEETDTLGGYIYMMVGQVPHPGQTVEVDHLVLRVEAVENRRIRKVHITRVPAPNPAQENDQEDEARQTRERAAARVAARQHS